MKYEKGKIYRFNSEISNLDSGDFIVTKVGKPRKHSGTIFIYFKFINDEIKKQQSFMIGSEFDFCSKIA